MAAWFIVVLLSLLTGCANSLEPICVSTMTTYVEGAKGITKQRPLYGNGATPDAQRRTARGAEARIGVALEWDMSGRSCKPGGLYE